MTDDIRDVFDVALAWGDEISRRRRHNETVQRLREASAKKCGNCEHWMKSSSCKREREYRDAIGTMGPNRALQVIVSCDDRACSDYLAKRSAQEASAELDELTRRKR